MKWIPPFGATNPNEQYVNAEPTVPGSNPPADFFNTILNELLAVIVAADMTPSEQVAHQLADAIVYLTERAATSGVTKGSFSFGKTTAGSSVQAPAEIGQTYIDFTTLNTYISNDGTTWTQTGTFVPPVGIDYTILITSKFWDIPEQAGQQGGEAKYNHTDDVWMYWPQIISFNNAALTGVSTCPTPTSNSPANQIVNKDYVDNHFVSTVLAVMYPVGAIYLGTQNTCPMATVMPGTTWQLVSTGRALWGGDGTNGNSTIAAGLPDITGGFSNWGKNPSSSGAFSHTTDSTGNRDSYSGNPRGIFTFAASRSNSHFGASSTVQPPAYVVNVWRRTA
ncbi:MAG: hypothetical protein IK122_01295 [Alphaproteobacteria bacterium]|nr:hypothetical protein [Alphaproteobacteria bacterium]